MDAAQRGDIEREVRAAALSKVRAKLGFAWHLGIFVAVNLALFAINRAYTPASLWFVWPLGAWAFGLAVHGAAVFQGTGVRESMLEAEIQRELARRGLPRS
jgi:hypothetical protein